MVQMSEEVVQSDETLLQTFSRFFNSDSYIVVLFKADKFLPNFNH
jgi:hypothetical protein